MHFAQHLIISWFVAEGTGVDNTADRRLIALAGVLPDIDVVPYVGTTLWNWAATDRGFPGSVQAAFNDVHEKVHHVYTHGIGFIAFTGLAALLWQRYRRGDPPGTTGAGKVVGLAMLVSLLHCLCDVLASGPQWPIYPLWPFSRTTWGYSWSWTLADWPNLLILGLCLLAARQYAVHKGRSPVEVFSAQLDRRFVKLVRGNNTGTDQRE